MIIRPRWCNKHGRKNYSSNGLRSPQKFTLRPCCLKRARAHTHTHTLFVLVLRLICWNCTEISFEVFYSCAALSREPWTTHKDGAHVTVNVWRAAKCSAILWTKGHNPSEIYRDMCGVYGKDCMDRSNVSRLCAFLKILPPWRMRTTWRRCYGPYSFPIHATHVPVNISLVITFSPQKSQ